MSFGSARWGLEKQVSCQMPWWHSCEKLWEGRWQNLRTGLKFNHQLKSDKSSTHSKAISRHDLNSVDWALNLRQLILASSHRSTCLLSGRGWSPILCENCNHKQCTTAHNISFLPFLVLQSSQQYLSHVKTKPTKWHARPAKTQIGLGMCPVWSESSLSAWRKLGSLATHWAHSEDSDQTGWMPRLIWVISGGTCHFVCFVMTRLLSVHQG